MVTWGWASADAAIALDVIPVAIPFQAYGGNEEGILPWETFSPDSQRVPALVQWICPATPPARWFPETPAGPADLTGAQHAPSLHEMLKSNSDVLPGAAQCSHPSAGDAREGLKATQARRERAAAMMRAMGEPGRLAIIELLIDTERCVTELAEILGTGVSTVSEKLKVLRNESLVKSRREGKHIFYALSDHHMKGLVSNLLDHAAEAGIGDNLQ